ncbi:MAG TPA: hypothetical protein VKI44_01170 [Acetobacteraceae bacterium]|nr:hypothetical protein [Acetobacteraceae bacterium]
MNEDEQLISPPSTREQRMQEYRARIHAKLQARGITGDELERRTDEILHASPRFNVGDLMR